MVCIADKCEGEARAGKQNILSAYQCFSRNYSPGILSVTRKSRCLVTMPVIAFFAAERDCSAISFPRCVACGFSHHPTPSVLLSLGVFLLLATGLVARVADPKAFRSGRDFSALETGQSPPGLGFAKPPRLVVDDAHLRLSGHRVVSERVSLNGKGEKATRGQ